MNTAALNTLTQRAIQEHWDFLPTAGSRIGLHEYDGRLPDFSAARIRRRVEQLNQSLAQLSALPADDPDSLDANGDARTAQLDRRLLELFLRRELFNLEEMRTLENNPQRQVGYIGVGSYVQRDYAPLPDRLRSAAAALRQVPDFLTTLNNLTEPELGEPVRDMAVRAYRGMASFYETGLADAAAQCAVAAPDVAAEFNAARASASVAASEFADRLQARSIRPEFAIGSQPVPTDAVGGRGRGHAPLRRALHRAGQPGTESAPAGRGGGAGRSGKIRPRGRGHGQRQPSYRREPDTGNARDAGRHPPGPHRPRHHWPAFRGTLPGHRNAPPTCATPSPPWTPPAAWKQVATEAFYYVTPVEPDWTPRQQEEWLSNFNYHTLKVISIHEVYPGHYVHNLHNRYGHTQHGRELSPINRVATSYAFTEGWAHYTEEMMLETDYGRDNPALWLTQLLEALVRNCRYLCSLGMHTQNMTLDEASRFFQSHAYMEEHPAYQEAIRGTFDPGYLNYTLGKLMLLKLRQDWRRQEGPTYTLRRFHDAALSWGAPPVPLLRAAMLNADDGAIL